MGLLKEQQTQLSNAQFRKMCRQDFLNYLRIREWQDLYTQLRQVVKEQGFAINSAEADFRSIHVSLLAGLLSHIGQKMQINTSLLGLEMHVLLFFLGRVYLKTTEMGNGCGTC